VQPAGIKEGKWFEGRVYVVTRDEVGMKLHGAFHAHKDKPCSIRFQLNRHPMRVQHQALATSNLQERILFPEPRHVRSDIAPSPDELEGPRFDLRILDNPAQLQAVSSIVHCRPGSAPFVIFGPCV
jgi:helicase MOV-10